MSDMIPVSYLSLSQSAHANTILVWMPTIQSLLIGHEATVRTLRTNTMPVALPPIPKPDHLPLESLLILTEHVPAQLSDDSGLMKVYIVFDISNNLVVYLRLPVSRL